VARPPEIDSGGEVTVPQRRAAGGLEEQVLAVLGAADGPLGPRDVQDRLGGALAYTTVTTTLQRLRDKGALVSVPGPGRARAYRLAAPDSQLPATMTARSMSRLLASEDDRAGVLAYFVADLSPDDAALLSELLAAERTDGRP
jgi:predicted transcriptional regulator